MGTFSIPLSGLSASQDQLQSVSNNLANIDTDGFKDQSLTFSDIFSQAVDEWRRRPLADGEWSSCLVNRFEFHRRKLECNRNRFQYGSFGERILRDTKLEWCE